LAEDAASGWLLTELEEAYKIPEASNFTVIKTDGEQFVNLLVLDMNSYTIKYRSIALK